MKHLNLYLLTQSVNNGYDTHDACVVAAENEQAARHIHPSRWCEGENWWERSNMEYDSWCLPHQVKVEFIGKPARSVKAGVVIASFNAG